MVIEVGSRTAEVRIGTQSGRPRHRARPDTPAPTGLAPAVQGGRPQTGAGCIPQMGYMPLPVPV